MIPQRLTPGGMSESAGTIRRTERIRSFRLLSRRIPIARFHTPLLTRTAPTIGLSWSTECDGAGQAHPDRLPDRRPTKSIELTSHPRRSSSSAFPSVFRCMTEENLENLNVARAEKQGNSRVWAVLTRWKSQVRIPEPPIRFPVECLAFRCTLRGEGRFLARAWHFDFSLFPPKGR